MASTPLPSLGADAFGSSVLVSSLTPSPFGPSPTISSISSAFPSSSSITVPFPSPSPTSSSLISSFITSSNDSSIIPSITSIPDVTQSFSSSTLDGESSTGLDILTTTEIFIPHTTDSPSSPASNVIGDSAIPSPPSTTSVPADSSTSSPAPENKSTVVASVFMAMAAVIIVIGFTVYIRVRSRRHHRASSRWYLPNSFRPNRPNPSPASDNFLVQNQPHVIPTHHGGTASESIPRSTRSNISAKSHDNLFSRPPPVYIASKPSFPSSSDTSFINSPLYHGQHQLDTCTVSSTVSTGPMASLHSYSTKLYMGQSMSRGKSASPSPIFQNPMSMYAPSHLSKSIVTLDSGRYYDECDIDKNNEYDIDQTILSFYEDGCRLDLQPHLKSPNYGWSQLSSGTDLVDDGSPSKRTPPNHIDHAPHGMNNNMLGAPYNILPSNQFGRQDLHPTSLRWSQRATVISSLPRIIEEGADSGDWYPKKPEWTPANAEEHDHNFLDDFSTISIPDMTYNDEMDAPYTHKVTRPAFVSPSSNDDRAWDDPLSTTRQTFQNPSDLEDKNCINPTDSSRESNDEFKSTLLRRWDKFWSRRNTLNAAGSV